MDYILYNEQSQMLARFACMADGVEHGKRLVEQWQSMGMRPPRLRLCYNGRASVQVWASEPDRAAVVPCEEILK
jgi:hypothetical protein